MNKIAFQKIDWTAIEKTNHPGHQGYATWQTLQFDSLRIRLVEYAKGYAADHWCERGHIVHCLEGSFVSELKTGEKFLLQKGDSYVVSDHMSSHRSYTETGVKLLIVDGEFLGETKYSISSNETF